MVALGFIGIIFISSSINQKRTELRLLNSDNLLWSFSRLEIDFVTLISLTQNSLDDSGQHRTEMFLALSKIESRLFSLYHSFSNADLEQKQTFDAAYGKITRTLNSIRAPLSSAQEITKANLGIFTTDLLALESDLDAFTTLGLGYTLKASNFEQDAIASDLRQLAIVTSLLIFVLIGVSIAMLKMYRGALLNERISDNTRQRFEAMISNSLDAVIVTSMEGIIEEYNGSAGQIFGYSRVEALGQDIADLIIPEKYKQAHHKGMERYRTSGPRRYVNAGRIKLDSRQKNNSTFPIEISLTEVRDLDRHVFVAFIRDITPEVNAKRELVDALDQALAGEKIKSDFLRTISHEVRTPLNGLLGTLDILSQSRLTKRQAEHVRNMSVSANALKHHVSNVLEISKLDSGETELEVDIFNLQRLVESVVAAHSALAQRRHNKIEIKWFNGKIQDLIGDAQKLRQILHSLLDNANKFTENGDITVEIKILASRSDKIIVQFNVIDTGIGITQEQQQDIFDDFVTLDSTYRRKAEGAGIGLGLVRRLANLLNAKLSVESDVGKGSKFHIDVKFELLPSHSVIPNDYVARVSEAQKTYNILIVEDNEINRKLLKEVLEKSGHRCIEAIDGKTGVYLSESQKFDIILMDISMPQMDGVEATELIRSGGGLSSNAPIVAVTVHCYPEEVAKFRAAGMDAVIPKPVDNMKLLARLDHFIRADETASTDSDIPQRPMSGPINLQIHAENSDMLGSERWKGLVGRMVQEVDEMFAFFEAERACELGRELLANKVHEAAGVAGQAGAEAVKSDLLEIERVIRNTDAENVLERLKKAKPNWENAKVSLADYGYLVAS